MTEEQGLEWLRLKTEVEGRMEEKWPEYVEDWRGLLVKTDPRIWEYLEQVRTDMSGHNLYELLAVVRFFDLLGRYRWSPSRVRHFFRFYESLRFSGATGRQRYRLTPVQCFQFASIFGFVREDGLRLCRTAYLFVPRKYGKTTSVASLAVYDLLFGDSNAQAYVGANSYNQAKICFDEIRGIMQDIDPAAKHFKVNREAILYKGNGRSSFARCLSANPKTLDGLNASLVIMDEYAQARDTKTKGGAELKSVLTSSMGVRREPLTVVITTASDVIDGPFRHELDGVMRILRGEAVSDTIFASLFMPDYGDSEDDPRTWAKVQPHLGVTVRPDFYEMEWDNAQLSSDAMMAFRTKLLNVFAENEERRWMTREQAESLMDAPGGSIDRVAGLGTCTGAFDLSVRDDMSSVGYLGFSDADGCFHAHVDYYMPHEAVVHHPHRVMYERWQDEGFRQH